MLPIKHLMQVDETVASIFDNKFCIPLDFEILESSLPFYQYGLGSRLTYELTFADYSNVIKASNPDASYTISNISLEFDAVTNASLASQIRTEYMKSSILYDRILRARIIPLNDSSTSFSVDIKDVHRRQKLATNFFKLFELTILVMTISISREKNMLTVVSGGSFFKGLDNKIIGFVHI